MPADSANHSEGPLGLIVTQGVKDITVIVTEGSVIVREEKQYVGGKQVKLPGPLAQQMVANGHARFKDS